MVTARVVAQGPYDLRVGKQCRLTRRLRPALPTQEMVYKALEELSSLQASSVSPQGALKSFNPLARNLVRDSVVSAWGKVRLFVRKSQTGCDFRRNHAEAYSHANHRMFVGYTVHYTSVKRYGQTLL